VSGPKRDGELGMKREITQRDFLNGFSLAVTALTLPGAAWGEVSGLPGAPLDAEKEAEDYPPAKTGLRGSHDGSLGSGPCASRRKALGRRYARCAESFDLIVVGGGISGLAAAYFYRKRAGEKARVLVLENHDDFGGHAKRNEFDADGRRLLGYRGTQSIAGPKLYSAEAKGLFSDLGIEVLRFEKYFDRKLFSSRGLSHGIFFDKKTFGTDRAVSGVGRPSWPESLAKTPLTLGA
jgi:spermidine dehydrogenase